MVNYYGDLFYRLVLSFYRNFSSAKSTFKKCMLQRDLSDTLLILSFVVLPFDFFRLIVAWLQRGGGGGRGIRR